MQCAQPAEKSAPPNAQPTAQLFIIIFFLDVPKHTHIYILFV